MCTDVTEGDVLMMASQKYIRQPIDSMNLPQVFDALETLIHGEVTRDSVLRTIDGLGETYAMVYKKGKTNIVYEH